MSPKYFTKELFQFHIKHAEIQPKYFIKEVFHIKQVDILYKCFVKELFYKNPNSLARSHYLAIPDKFLLFPVSIRK